MSPWDFRKDRSGVPRRSYHSRPRKTTVLIVCEGETERNYFHGLKREDAVRRRFAITINAAKGGSPQAVAKFAVKQKKDSGADYDEVWCVMDVESPTRLNELQQAIKYLNRYDIRACLSNPAFEVWLLAHFERTASPFPHCAAVLARLNSHWEKHFGERYEKSDLKIYIHVRQWTHHAIENARWVRETHHDAGRPVIECNSSTEVYLLVLRLRDTPS